MDTGKVVKGALKGLIFGKQMRVGVEKRLSNHDESCAGRGFPGSRQDPDGNGEAEEQPGGCQEAAMWRTFLLGYHFSLWAKKISCLPTPPNAFPDPYPSPSVLWRQGCVRGGRHHGEVNWRKEWRTSSTCWRSVPSSTYAQNKSCWSKSEQQSPVPCVVPSCLWRAMSEGSRGLVPSWAQPGGCNS